MESLLRILYGQKQVPNRKLNIEILRSSASDLFDRRRKTAYINAFTRVSFLPDNQGMEA